MRLDILISHYKERIEILLELLNSIEMQENIDFSNIRVIICGDGGVDIEKDINIISSSYSFDIEYHYCVHCGISGIRNLCLSYSDADYVMFCDCDDVFYGKDIFGGVLNIDKDFDYMISHFYEENGIELYRHYVDSIYIHGKIYRRDFLVNNKIRFNEILTKHEDNYFNSLVYNCVDKDRIIVWTNPFYIWKDRGVSVSKQDRFMFITFNDLIMSVWYLLEELERRGKTDNIGVYICRLVYEAYFRFTSLEWKEIDIRVNIEKYFIEFLRRYSNKWNCISKEIKDREYLGIKDKMINECHYGEIVDFSVWLKRIQKKYK